METATTGPMRTCVACREEADRDELIRLVADPTAPGTVAIDYRAKLPGRGGWVHPTAACVTTLEQRPGMLSRALDVDVTTAGLLARIRVVVMNAALDGLSMAAAAGALVGGADVLAEAVGKGQIVEIVVASDASPRTLADLEKICAGRMLFTTLPLDRDALGTRIGRGSRAALGVTASRATSHLRRQLRRLRGLG